jgi:hypothetical protein
MARYQNILKIVGWIDSNQRRWVEHYCRINAVWSKVQKIKKRRGWIGF